jgi:flavin reductase (DIM6/NTAB) family NADH-FMN oxidoreductase RutF
VPLLADAIACLECEIAAVHTAGDHWIVVGHVLHHHSTGDEEPLIFYASGFRSLRVPVRGIRRGAR